MPLEFQLVNANPVPGGTRWAVLLSCLWLACAGVSQGAGEASITITLNPSNITAYLGHPVVFAAGAIATIPGNDNPPISYQWQRLDPGQTNWVDIPGADQATYTTVFTSCRQSATQFRCVASVQGASATSSPASVYAYADDLYPVFINQAPVSQTVLEGCTAQFTVTAFGQIGLENFSPLTYQWFRDDVPVSDATNQSYTVAPVTLADSGTRVHVVVSNACGAVATSNVWLTVAVGDVFPPEAVCAVSISPTQLVVFYNKPVLGGDLFAYELDGGATLVDARERPGDASVAEVDASPLSAGSIYHLKICGITDFAGNVLSPNPATLEFAAREARSIQAGSLSSTTISGGRLLLEWEGNGSLELAEKLSGPWVHVQGAATPYLVSRAKMGCGGGQNWPQRFYRLRLD